MLTLINGDGNPRVTAAQDADWYGSLTGEKTCIMPANDKFSATVADANTIEISSGVLITKEGRRVQIDAETIEEIIIPTGTQGTDTYYIIGFHLYIDESGQQVAETFVETMENESDTITETTFREGSTSIYISLYRVKRSGLTLESVTRICPMYELSADEIVYGNTNVGAKLTQINSDLSSKQDKTDNSLATSSKTVIGAINELKGISDLRPFQLHGGCPNDNANWANLNGIYTVGPGTEGTPNYYGILVVFASKNTGFDGSNWIVQLFFPTTEEQVYTRKSTNATDGGAWSSWVTLR